MSTTRMTRGWIFLALLSSFVFVFFTCSTALAATIDIQAIRQQIKKRHARWIAAETSITKLSPERRLKRVGLKGFSGVPKGVVVESTPPPTQQAVTYSNYADSGFVTPVRDQGDCGDCWAFATTAALESQVLIGTGGVGASSLDLSEETLLSCCGARVCGDCSGGYIDSASAFIQNTGLPPESCFPYANYSQTRQTPPACSSAACTYWQSNTDSIKGWHWVALTSPTVDNLKNALQTYGPLVTTMNVYNDFYSYSGGVYSYVGGAGDTYQGGHAIEIVGYDDADQCFIVKNSWGTGWGETADGQPGGGGFFRIAYSEVNDHASQRDQQYGAFPYLFGCYTIAYDGYTPVQSSCSYSISPTSTTVNHRAHHARVWVTSQSGCPWTAVSNVDWIKVVSKASHTGNGKIKYRIRKNKSLTGRTGTLTIGGQTFTVTQEGRPQSNSAPAQRYYWWQ